MSDSITGALPTEIVGQDTSSGQFRRLVIDIQPGAGNGKNDALRALKVAIEAWAIDYGFTVDFQNTPEDL